MKTFVFLFLSLTIGCQTLPGKGKKITDPGEKEEIGHVF